MTVSNSLYNAIRKGLGDGTVDWDTDTIKVALVTSSYTFDAAHDEWADVSANEVAAGAGYTTGGIALSGKTVTLATTVAKYIADAPVWSSLTKTFRFGVVYKVGSANGLTDPLICCILFDTTPANIVVTAADFTIQWNANGVIRLT